MILFQQNKNISKQVKCNCILTCLFFFILLCQISCKKETPIENQVFTPYQLQIPKGFDEPEIPSENQLSQERVALGKMLFFDPILSRDSSISCGTCHLQNLAFTDGNEISIGIENRKGFRNTVGLSNVAYQPYLFKEGGVPTLEQQVIAPIEDENEMDFTFLEAVKRIEKHPIYPDLILKAYGRDVDAYSISRAIACFERTLISGNSNFDRYEFHDEKTALNESEIRGKNLFFSDKTNCSSCHNGFNFTNNAFENNGLLNQYDDQGRFRITFDSTDIGKFKIPSLRNVEQTAPYMHNGSLGSLEEVVEHYNSGGSDHSNKNPQIEGLNLSEEEKIDLVAFLKSLTDWDFLENEAYIP